MQDSPKTDEVLTTALDRFDAAEDYFSLNYKQGEADSDFVLGNQWPENIKTQREAEGRPCLTENLTLSMVNRAVNQIKQIRPKIRPRPVDDKADIETADVLKGVIRNIEHISDAESAYGTAIWNSVTRGFGWLRINTKYIKGTFNQEIVIDRVLNSSSVYIDPNSIRLDGSDAEYVFIFDDMDKDDFETSYPDAKSEGFESSNDGWLDDDKIRIAEYYYKDYETKTLVQLSDGTVLYKEDSVAPMDIIQERDEDVCVIKYCKLTADEVLEENIFPGEYLPIIPVYGMEAWEDGKRVMYSMVHQAKQPQQMYNFWRTATTEIFALQPKAPYIGLVGQFNTQAQQWATANNENYAYLEYDAVEGINGETIVQPPQRQMPPALPAGVLQETMSIGEGIKAVLGTYDAALGNQTGDVSGKAIIARTMNSDNANYHFLDNLEASMRHLGRVLIDLIPLIYSDRQVLRIIGDDDVEKQVPINQPVVKQGKDYRPVNGNEQQTNFFQLDQGKYDAIVDVGPGHATKRQESANAIIEIARVNPEILNVAGDLLMKSLDVPYAQEIAERIKAQMPPELRGDDPEAAKIAMMTDGIQQLQQQLDEANAALQVKAENTQFNQQIELAKLELEKQKLELDATKAMNDASNKRREVDAEAAKDYAEAMEKTSATNDRLIDLEFAFNELLSQFEGAMATGEPYTPATNANTATT